MKTVIYVNGTEKFPDRRRIAGLSEYARSRGWNLQTVEALKSAGQLKEVIRIWEPDGFVLLYKRLSVAEGRYRWPRNKDEVRPLTWRELDWLLSGLDIDQPRAIRAS